MNPEQAKKQNSTKIHRLKFPDLITNFKDSDLQKKYNHLDTFFWRISHQKEHSISRSKKFRYFLNKDSKSNKNELSTKDIFVKNDKLQVAVKNTWERSTKLFNYFPIFENSSAFIIVWKMTIILFFFFLISSECNCDIKISKESMNLQHIHHYGTFFCCWYACKF